MATRTISKAGGNSNEVGAYVENELPTASDDIVATAESGNFTVNATLTCRSLNLTNYVSVFKKEAAINIGTSSPGPENIAVKFPTAGWTYTQVGTAVIKFQATSGTEQTIDFGGKEITHGIEVNANGGKYKLASNLTMGTAATLLHTRGTLDIDGRTLNIGKFSGTSTNTRELKLGAATISLTGTATVWDYTTVTGLTYSGALATITIANTSASEKKFIAGGQTYGNLTVTPGGAGVVVIAEASSSTWGIMTLSGPKTIKFGKGKTQTITTLVAKGTAGNLVTIESTGAGEAATLSQAAGTVEGDYLKIKDSHATGGATFYAGSHSESVSGNEGWKFEDPAAAPAMGTPTSAGVIARDLTETIKANGKATTYYFQLVTDTQFKIDEWTSATKVPEVEASAGESKEAKEVTQLARGLSNGTKYHFRCIAKNSSGTSTGSAQTFTPTSGGSFSLIESV